MGFLAEKNTLSWINHCDITGPRGPFSQGRRKMSALHGLDTSQKALAINLQDHIYGTFAEIGAGQEVARHFFRAGGAAGTIAKSMSAYDMAISDAIYGKTSRYVSEDRLSTMLEREYDQLVERLGPARGDKTSFFAFADTVAAKSFRGNSDSHGWLGMRFQHNIGAGASQVIVHVRMLDKANLQQQEALGILGVNLVYACYHYSDDRDKFISSLLEQLTVDRVQIDMIEVKGPAFGGVDSRLWSLELVKKGICQAVLFDRTGDIVNPKDLLYRRHVLCCRGSYRPPTLVNIDMLERGKERFAADLPKEEREDIIILPEISMNKLRERGEVDGEDFLARVDILAALGQYALISNYETYAELSYYLSTCTKMKMCFVFGHYNMIEIFEEDRYAKNPGGLLGGLGGLLGHRTTLYCYPAQDPKTGSMLTSKEAPVAEVLKPLVTYLEGRNLIANICNVDTSVFHIWSREVLRMIQQGESGWEAMVPPVVVKAVKERCLFGYPCET
jgi:hypothetical protein